MGRENLAAKLYGDGENLETHDPDLTLVPRPGNESEQEHDLEAIKEYRTTFSIPTKIPRGYADTRHKRPSPDEEVVLKDGKVDGLQVVLDVSKNHPLLSAERELELAKLIERGDLSAKEEMFKSNLRLVVNIAKRYRGSSVAFGDLVQYGMVGLNRAVEKFDWRKGYRFSTYATWWIRQAIERERDNTEREIRVPIHVAKLERKIRRAENILATALGYEPSDEEIAQETGISLDEVMKIRQGAHVTTSLDKPIGDEGDATIGDVLDVKGAVIEEEVEDKLEHETLQKAIDELPEAERIVIEMRFEIDGNETTSLRLVGRKLNVSTERARQIQKRALKRLAQNEELIALKDAEK